MSCNCKRGSKSFLSFLILFVGLFLYWAYLAFVTEPILVHDAKGYQDLAQMIYQKGWKAYFISGPNREPIYPFFVSLCMRMGGEDSYQTALKFFQFGFLLTALILTFVILAKCRIAPWIRIFAIAYLGVSPAFVNSALSIYSEIVTFIPILGIILLSTTAWSCFQEDSSGPSLKYGLGLAVFFIAITLSKGIYEIIFPFFLVPFIVLAMDAFFAKNKKVFRNVTLFLLTSVLVYGVCIAGYKGLNKRYNGLFTLTDRGAWAMYGNTARRQEPLTLRRFLAGGAYNLFGEDDCAALIDRASCHFWDIRTSDDLAAQKNYEVSAKFPLAQRDVEFAKLIRERILHNPLQYIVLTGFDWVHMFFWESTRIGFVAYPDWLDKIFDNAVFAKFLRFVVGLISLFSTVLCCFYLWRHKKIFWQADQRQSIFLSTLFFLIYLIVCHVSFYSLFATVARFALPIAPLFVLVVACAAQILFFKEINERKN